MITCDNYIEFLGSNKIYNYFKVEPSHAEEFLIMVYNDKKYIHRLKFAYLNLITTGTLHRYIKIPENAKKLIPGIYIYQVHKRIEWNDIKKLRKEKIKKINETKI